MFLHSYPVSFWLALILFLYPHAAISGYIDDCIRHVRKKKWDSSVHDYKFGKERSVVPLSLSKQHQIVKRGLRNDITKERTRPLNFQLVSTHELNLFSFTCLLVSFSKGRETSDSSFSEQVANCHSLTPTYHGIEQMSVQFYWIAAYFSSFLLSSSIIVSSIHGNQDRTRREDRIELRWKLQVEALWK